MVIKPQKKRMKEKKKDLQKQTGKKKNPENN